MSFQILISLLRNPKSNPFLSSMQLYCTMRKAPPSGSTMNHLTLIDCYPVCARLSTPILNGRASCASLNSTQMLGMSIAMGVWSFLMGRRRTQASNAFLPKLTCLCPPWFLLMRPRSTGMLHMSITNNFWTGKPNLPFTTQKSMKVYHQ